MEALALIRPEGASVELPGKPFRVLGIDLGTTNSTVAELIWNPDDPASSVVRCLEIDQPTAEGIYTHVLVPSVLAIHQGKVITGEGAKRLRARAAELKLEQNQNLFYECKNDIGTKRTYHRAPEGFRSAAEIGGRVLGFLRSSAAEFDGAPIERVVVTVPASFQAAQRNDTLEAAKLAGIHLSGGDLLDEPVAAFLDYIVTYGSELVRELNEPKNLVIFDFGGGTCDVAVFKIRSDAQGGRIQIDPLAVSRYHRLGGGDIDAAILHEILAPQLREQNGLSKFDLGYEEKKKFVEPAFLSLAESLKISLCTEVGRLKRFDKYDGADKTRIASRQPGLHSRRIKDRDLALRSPQLTAEEFEKLLEPFLDQYLLYARETEYRMTCSIFAPLQDALDRSEMEAGEADYCLLVGGSSLIPQVVEALEVFFCNAEILTYPDRDSIQTSVARGAAYHALSLALFGKGMIQPVCHDRIGIRTSSGLVELVPKGAALPYPPDGSYARNHSLAVPETTLVDPIRLRVEIVGGDDERSLFGSAWMIAGPVNKGDALLLEYRYDENQHLDLKLRVANSDDADPFKATVENPLTNVVNPQNKRLKIDEIEEEIRTGKIAKAAIPDRLVEVAEAYAEMGQREKALDYLKRVLIRRPGDANILNRMGMYAGELGDFERQEKFYREAAAASDWAGPLFNLALAQMRRKLYAEAVETIAMAVDNNPEGAYLVLWAMLAERLGNDAEREEKLGEAFRLFDPVSSLTDWELGWFITGARMTGDEERIAAAEAERKRRGKKKGAAESDEGMLPDQTKLPQRVRE